MRKREAVTLALRLMGFWALAFWGIPRVQMVAGFASQKLGGGVIRSVVTSGWDSVYVMIGAILLIVCSHALGRFLCPADDTVDHDHNAASWIDYSAVALSVLGVYVVVVAAMALTRTGAEMLELKDITARDDVRSLAFRLTAQGVCGGMQLGLGVGLFLQRRGAATVWRLIRGKQRFAC